MDVVYALLVYVAYGIPAGIMFKLMVELFFYAVNALMGIFRNITK